MGDPRRLKGKYEGPRHPWESERLEAERILTKEYGLKNKKEIWKALSKLKHFSSQVKKLVNLTTPQAEKEKKQLLEKVYRLGIIPKDAAMGDILGLNIRNMLDRRLQTIVVKKGLARTVKQARQMITHGHILVNNKKVSVPSYYVLVDEESSVSFITKSPFTDEMHPERSSEKAAPKPGKKKAEGKEEQAEEKKEEKKAAKKAKPKAEKKEEVKEEKAEEKKEAREEKTEKKEEKKEEAKK